jgi:hypothetical protein
LLSEKKRQSLASIEQNHEREQANGRKRPVFVGVGAAFVHYHRSVKRAQERFTGVSPKGTIAVLAARNCWNPRRMRVVAVLVLSVMVWSVVAPVAMGATGTLTPACCRRDGKHHCLSGMSGMAGMPADDCPSFRVSSFDCPYRSQIAAATGVAQPQRSSISAPRLPYATFAGENCLFFASRLSASNSQRGPPAYGL